MKADVAPSEVRWTGWELNPAINFFTIISCWLVLLEELNNRSGFWFLVSSLISLVDNVLSRIKFKSIFKTVRSISQNFCKCLKFTGLLIRPELITFDVPCSKLIGSFCLRKKSWSTTSWCWFGGQYRKVEYNSNPFDSESSDIFLSTVLLWSQSMVLRNPKRYELSEMMLFMQSPGNAPIANLLVFSIIN